MNENMSILKMIMMNNGTMMNEVIFEDVTDDEEVRILKF